MEQQEKPFRGNLQEGTSQLSHARSDTRNLELQNLCFKCSVKCPSSSITCPIVYLFHDTDEHSLAKHAQLIIWDSFKKIRPRRHSNVGVDCNCRHLRLQNREITLSENNSTFFILDLKPLS